MVAKIRSVFVALCIAMSFVAPVKAIIETFKVLRKFEDGKAHYIYCLADHHAINYLNNINLWYDHLGPDGLSEHKRLFGVNMTAQAVGQIEALKGYIAGLGARNFMMINEDTCEYNGTDECSRKSSEKMSWNQANFGWDFLRATSEMFQQQKWTYINAECRYSMVDTKLFHHRLTNPTGEGFDYLRQLLKTITDEIDSSPASVPLKKFSKKQLTKFDTKIQNWFKTDLSLKGLNAIDTSFLLDARLPHLVLKHRHINHMFLAFGRLHIERLLPCLEKLGYEVIFDRASPAIKNYTEFMIDVVERNLSPIETINQVPIDLKEAFSGFEKSEFKKSAGELVSQEASYEAKSNTLGLEKKNDATSVSNSNSNASSSLSQGTGPSIVCGQCGASKPNMPHCTACKSVFYCSKDCQQKHWAEHKKMCKKI